jgi:hypothetical protein
MFDSAQHAVWLAASRTARAELAGLIHRFRLIGRYAEVVSKRLARSIARATDLYDDSCLLLENERLTSSIIVARAFLEQVGHAAYIVERATEFGADLDGLEAALVDLDNRIRDAEAPVYGRS